jgi:Asp-tRNA(Asn)/Glu-tRNA(Gln) amidotransferase A subunit family amidase
MDQLAWTMTGQAPGRPPCPNPAAAGALCGGSSGGSAAAVAAGIVSIALGTDTAGSIRVPAAWCSIVGYKPTRHLVSLAGCAPLAPNFDCIGVVTHSIGDCVLAARALGADISYAARGRRIRIGVPEEALEAEVEGFEALIENLATAGHHVRTVSLSLAARGYGRLLAAEFATAWADAVAPEDVSEEIRAGLHHGQTVAATAYLGVHGALATAERRARSVFDAVDVLALPTTPAGPPPVGTPVVVADVSRFTRVFSAYGWPAITLPTARGALQLVARPGADDVLLAIADALWPGRQSPSAVPEQSRLA